jgi:hypothetical protein
MKVCQTCGEEISTLDGEGECQQCQDTNGDTHAKAVAARKRAKARRRERDQVLRDLGLVKVRGAMGGTYWE